MVILVFEDDLHHLPSRTRAHEYIRLNSFPKAILENHILHCYIYLDHSVLYLLRLILALHYFIESINFLTTVHKIP